MRLADIARADVQDLADRLTGEGLSASTVQNILDPLRVIFRRAIRRDFVAVDPTEHLELRRPKGHRDRIASHRRRRRSSCCRCCPTSNGHCGRPPCTPGCVPASCALRWPDVDLPGRVIHGRRDWDDEEGEHDGKSDAAERDVPILDPLARELAAHKLRSGGSGDELVFGLTAEQPFYRSTVNGHAKAAWDAEE